MPRPKTDIRERLLADTMFYVTMHGVATLNLRDLAAALGTSHRMLIFHFGSKEGLLTEITSAVRTQHRELLRRVLRDSDQGPEEGLRTLWRELTDPAYAPRLRLIFELYGQAIQGRRYAVGLLEHVADVWEAPVTEILRRADPPASHPSRDAHLTAAVIHGLLLGFLTTGDAISANDAFERFLTAFAADPPRRRADSGR